MVFGWRQCLISPVLIVQQHTKNENHKEKKQTTMIMGKHKNLTLWRTTWREVSSGGPASTSLSATSCIIIKIVTIARMQKVELLHTDQVLF